MNEWINEWLNEIKSSILQMYVLLQTLDFFSIFQKAA